MIHISLCNITRVESATVVPSPTKNPVFVPSPRWLSESSARPGTLTHVDRLKTASFFSTILGSFPTTVVARPTATSEFVRRKCCGFQRRSRDTISGYGRPDRCWVFRGRLDKGWVTMGQAVRWRPPDGNSEGRAEFSEEEVTS